MPYPIAVVESVAETVLELHRTVRARRAGDDIGEGMRELYAMADRLGLTPTGPPSTTYHGDFEGTRTLRVVLALPVAERAGETTDHMTVRATEPLTFARTIHHGDYHRIGAAYRALQDWIRASGLRPAGPMTEIYLVGPDAALRPGDLTTEIRVPVVARVRPYVRFDAPVPAVVDTVRDELHASGLRVLSEVDIDATIGVAGTPRPHVLLTACLPTLAQRVRDIDPARDRMLFLDFVVRGTDGQTVVEFPDFAGLTSDTTELESALRALRTAVADLARRLGEDGRAGDDACAVKRG